MRNILIPALLAATAFATPAAAATITPVAVTATSTFPFWGQYRPERLIDGSGLSGGLHDTDYNGMWLTDNAVTARLTFDLGDIYQLDGAMIWNYNFGSVNEFASTLLRGVRDFIISLSTDGVSYSYALSDRLAMGTGEPLASQDFALNGDARYVRLDVLNNYGFDQYRPQDISSGLSEVRFSSASAVPEPATWAMMITGFGLVGAMLRRRRVATVNA